MISNSLAIGWFSLSLLGRWWHSWPCPCSSRRGKRTPRSGPGRAGRGALFWDLHRPDAVVPSRLGIDLSSPSASLQGDLVCLSAPSVWRRSSWPTSCSSQGSRRWRSRPPGWDPWAQVRGNWGRAQKREREGERERESERACVTQKRVFYAYAVFPPPVCGQTNSLSPKSKHAVQWCWFLGTVILSPKHGPHHSLFVLFYTFLSKAWISSSFLS